MYDKLVIVTRRTPLEDLTLRLNSPAQARFYLEQSGVDFADYALADATYRSAVANVLRQLPRAPRRQQIDRDLLPTFQFGERDLVIVIGQDGLVVNTAKYLAAQPIIGINPDPDRFDGTLLPCAPDVAGAWVALALRGRATLADVSMAMATLADGQRLYAVNDLFIGQRGHSAARYQLSWGGRQETQISSGLIVSTGAGGTGWMRSIVAGAMGVAQQLGAVGEPDVDATTLAWDSDRLWCAVREPFVSRRSSAELIFGQIGPREELVVTSQMPEGGAIFSDGIESDYLAFSSGAVARIGLADRRAKLMVMPEHSAMHRQ